MHLNFCNVTKREKNEFLNKIVTREAWGFIASHLKGNAASSSGNIPLGLKKVLHCSICGGNDAGAVLWQKVLMHTEFMSNDATANDLTLKQLWQTFKNGLPV